MKNILDTIVARKWVEIRQAKENISIKELESAIAFETPAISFAKTLANSHHDTGIIAEFKRKSPSKGIFNAHVQPEIICPGYETAGATACSILTDTDFFGGRKEDLITARPLVHIPILRKDFMVDEYQFIEAKSWGADIVLLIAAILTPKRTVELAAFAKSLGLQVLLELHDENELQHVNQYVDLVGINNRNLKNFEVDIERSARMAEQLNKNYILVAESGIASPETITYFRGFGFKAFLMGETFMKEDDPANACRKFIKSIKEVSNAANLTSS